MEVENVGFAGRNVRNTGIGMKIVRKNSWMKTDD